MNITRFAAAGLLAAATVAQAAPTPGIGQSGGLTWEQVRFYGPSAGKNSTYLGGQPTYLGSTAKDHCSGSDICGETLSFNTVLGGALTVTASDKYADTKNLVIQDLSPTYGGLGVIGLRSGSLVGADDINAGDKLTLSFANKVQVVGFHFWDKDHSNSDLNTGDKFGLSIDGGATKFYDLKNFPWYGANSTLVGSTFTFSYKNEDYYLGAIKIASVTAVPEPESYALMLAGLLAGGFMLSRRKG